MSLKPSSPHVPTRNDVQLVRRMLVAYLPLELADEILDDAMYWPMVTSVSVAALTSLNARQGPGNDASRCCLITPPLPGLSGMAREGSGIATFKARMVRFKVRSYDQGWGGKPNLPGPYDGAWSWFEAVILRPTFLQHIDVRGKALDTFFLEFKSVLPSKDQLRTFGFTYGESPLNDGPRWMLQRNAKADKVTRDHEIAWTMHGAESGDADSGDGAGFVSALRPGDKGAVIAGARFPGWINFVKSVRVDVYCAA